MVERRPGPGSWSLLTLAHSRSLLRPRRIAALAVLIAVVYAGIAMLVGGMLSIFYPPAHLSSFWVILLAGTPSWDYPGLLAATPYFAVELPFLPTVFMILTSAGVGLGMSVAVVLGATFVRRRRAAGQAAAVGTAAGLTPAMIALVTLGACCSTTAASVAGIGITAQATGTSTGALLANNWYLGLFQLVILYVALLAQEQLLTVYGALVSDRSGSSAVSIQAPAVTRRFIAGAALRVALLAAGVTWCLAMVADWLTVSPTTASAGTWAAWLLQYQLVGWVAVVAALVPLPTYRALARGLSEAPGLVFRALLVLAGASLAIGMPPPLALSGWHGLVNELLGLAGAPAAWGAVAPSLPLGTALVLRWGFQYVLLGTFAIVLGLRPRLALRPILWTVVGAADAVASLSGSAQSPTGVRGVPESPLGLSPGTQR